jgi:hypothetical protein
LNYSGGAFFVENFYKMQLKKVKERGNIYGTEPKAGEMLGTYDSRHNDR